MSQDAYRLISPDGAEMELPVHHGTTGPDVIDISEALQNQRSVHVRSGLRVDRQL